MSAYHIGMCLSLRSGAGRQQNGASTHSLPCLLQQQQQNKEARYNIRLGGMAVPFPSHGLTTTVFFSPSLATSFNGDRGGNVTPGADGREMCGFKNRI